ncbi:MAG TPA: response regulator transcription factor [Terriglobales bacterium]|nr:response regulator transcription factor [Terriglobales bacterium]
MVNPQLKPAQGGKAVRVLVADSSRIHTQLLSEALKRDPELDVVSWNTDPHGLLAAALAGDINVLAVSSALNGHPARGLDTLRELRVARPSVRAVVLLDSRKPEAILDAFRAGARGVFNRDSSVEMFCKCIRSVHQGQIWADSADVALVIEALASTPRMHVPAAEGLSLLSKREAEVVQCLVQGLTNREIAERMGLSQHTVKNYLFRVFDKLGVSSRIELLFMTLSQGSNSEQPSARAASAVLPNGNHTDDASLAALRKAAEAGEAAAQLSLCQAYARRAEPDDLVRAYMWFLVAKERAAEAGRLLLKQMSPQQIEEAEQQAASWLSRLKKVSLLPDLS